MLPLLLLFFVSTCTAFGLYDLAFFIKAHNAGVPGIFMNGDPFIPLDRFQFGIYGNVVEIRSVQLPFRIVEEHIEYGALTWYTGRELDRVIFVMGNGDEMNVIAYRQWIENMGEFLPNSGVSQDDPLGTMVAGADDINEMTATAIRFAHGKGGSELDPIANSLRLAKVGQLRRIAHFSEDLKNAGESIAIRAGFTSLDQAINILREGNAERELDWGRAMEHTLNNGFDEIRARIHENTFDAFENGLIEISNYRQQFVEQVQLLNERLSLEENADIPPCPFGL